MKNYSVVLGSFDGVHKGHQRVIDLAAQTRDTTVAAVYFFEPPSPDGIKKELITNEPERCRLFKKAGVKELLALKFDEVKALSPEEFFGFLQEKFAPKVICCGFNYRFGKNAAGDINILQSLCDNSGVELRVAQPVKVDSKTVSSTAIRECLINGNIVMANRMLGRCFSFDGRVEKGDGRGKGFGFPTANVPYPGELVKPKAGVYVSHILVDGKCFNAVTNLGGRPTFPTSNPPAESYSFDDCGSLYGKTVKIELLEYIREQRQFESETELTKAINADVCTAKRIFENK